MGKKRFRKKFNKRQRKPYPKLQNKTPFNNPKEFTNRKTEFIIKESLREDQVGITEYINKEGGFKGILKSRFSDFHVNEIDLTGEILQLNDLNVPEPEEELSAEGAKLAKEELNNLISDDVWNRINALKEAKIDNSKKPEDSAILIDVSEFDKEQRTLVHKLIAKLYENKLVSSTVKGELAGCKEADKRFIRVMKSKGRDRNKWMFGREYVHFLVHKENFDTSEVASIIAHKLNLKPSQVNYCGTKDKRAKTTQKFSIKKRTPRQIVGTVKFLNGVKIGNFKFKNKFLKLGDLHGNRFRIALRNLTGEKQRIETSLENVKEQGFINYFGMQRFGNCSTIPTYEVGVALLKADYKLASELILKPRDNDVAFLKSIREMWWKNRDSKAAAAQIRGDHLIEKKLLEGLAQFGENDYAAALRKIPRNMLLLYPHAFQSLIYNYVASKRIKEFGLSLIPGDLVYQIKDDLDVDIESTELPEQEDNDEIERKNVRLSTANTESSKSPELPEQGDNNDEEIENPKLLTPNAENSKTIFKRKIKELTEEDIASGAYSIYDLVLPLPGYDIAYPENVVGSWYEELMEKYELSSEKLKHSLKTFSMKGAYRKLVVKPRDMSWEFKSYSTPEETLILSDLELLEGKKLEDFKKVSNDSKYEALLLDFCLPTASYATMMLRELLKSDTSAAAQSALQQASLNEHTSVNKIGEEAQSVELLGQKRTANENERELIKPPKLLKDNE